MILNVSLNIKLKWSSDHLLEEMSSDHLLEEKKEPKDFVGFLR